MIHASAGNHSAPRSHDEARDTRRPRLHLAAENVAAERSVLGALLAAPDATQDVEDLQPTDFALPRHAVIFDAMKRRLATGGVIDCIAIAEDLRRRGQLADAGAEHYLADLATDAVALRVPHHAAVIRENAERRRLHRLAVEAAEAALACEPLDEVRQRLERAAESKRNARDNGVQDWRAVAQAPPVPWMVEGRVPLGGLVVLAGEPGAGKTLLAFDLALRAVHGMPWLGRHVRPASTLYCAAEGFSGLGTRLRAWCAANPAARQIADQYLTIVDGVPDLTRGPHALDGRVRAAVRQQGHAPQLVVLDTWAMATPGADENDAGSAGAAVAAIAEVRRRHGCAMLVLHHVRKPQPGAPQRADQHALRGSSALAGAADVVLLAVVDGEENMLRVAKSRDAEHGPPARYAIRSQDTGLARDDGRSESGPIVLPAADADRPQALRLENAAQLRHERDVQQVCNALRDLGAPATSIDQIVALTGIGKTTGRAAVRTAMSRGLIERTGSSRDPQFRCVCEDSPIPPVGDGRRSPGDGVDAPSTPKGSWGVDRASGVDPIDQGQPEQPGGFRGRRI